MDKITIHKRYGGKYHYPFKGKATIYEVVSGATPFGPNGGTSGKIIPGGGKIRETFVSKHPYTSTEALQDATDFACSLAVSEGLEFVTKSSPKDNKSIADAEIDLAGEIADARIRKLVDKVIRPGQARFRKNLIEAYDGECAVTGCRVHQALQGAHIRPHLGEVTHLVANGLLLRADIHLLFDANLIALDPSNMTVIISDCLKGTEYDAYNGKAITLPTIVDKLPNMGALAWRRSRLL